MKGLMQTVVCYGCLLAPVHGFVPAGGRLSGQTRRSRGAAPRATNVESLGDLRSHTRLNVEQLLEFERKGHTLVRGLASEEEMDLWRPRWLKGGAGHTHVHTRTHAHLQVHMCEWADLDIL